MKKIFAGTALLAIAAAAWAGGDVWKTKPYSQWDQKDIATILQSSPWAKPAQQVQGAWHPDGTAAADTSNIGVAGSGTDTSNRSAGANANQPGGTEKEAEAQAAQQMYNVFWWSSRTIREASARRAVLSGAATQEQADKMVAAPMILTRFWSTHRIWRFFNGAVKTRSSKSRFCRRIRTKRSSLPRKWRFRRRRMAQWWGRCLVSRRRRQMASR